MKNTFKALLLLCAVLTTMLVLMACDEEEHSHTAKKVEAVSATCIAEGNNEYYACSGCDKVFTDEDCTNETTVEAQKLSITAHTPNADDGDCTTAVKCSVCGTVTTEANASHEPEEDDGDCTTEVKCSICDTVTTEANASHEPEEDDGDCTTEVKCSACGTVTTEANASHEPEEDDGDCTTAVKCSVCGTVTTEAKTEHVDDGLDGACDFCSFEFDYIYDESTNTYIVFTADGLYTWADNTWTGANLVLKKDIALPTEMNFDLDEDGTNDSNWDPARTSATIDGNGHSITGLTIIDESGSYVGFLSNLDEGGIVRNLFLKDVTIRADGGIGGIAAYSYGTIVNCGVSGKISSTSSNVGGIVGACFGGSITACYNDADITGTTEGAGAMGGIVGQYSNEGSKIIACYNTGDIKTISSNVGGIAGAFYDGSIIASYSTGYVGDSAYSGGITGGSSDILLETYWSTTGNSPTYGTSSKPNSEECTKVDGESVSWTDAMNAMNTALETEGCDWRYELNTDDDSAARPLVLVNIAD